MTCPDCAHLLDHCHGTLLVHADATPGCTDPACVDTGRERHELSGEVGGPDQRAPLRHADRGGQMAGTGFERHPHDAVVHDHDQPVDRDG